MHIHSTVGGSPSGKTPQCVVWCQKNKWKKKVDLSEFILITRPRLYWQQIALLLINCGRAIVARIPDETSWKWNQKQADCLFRCGPRVGWDRLYPFPRFRTLKWWGRETRKKKSVDGRKKLRGFGATPEEFPVRWECLAKKGGGNASGREAHGGLRSAQIARTMMGQ